MKRYTMDTTKKRCHDAANHSTEIAKKGRARSKVFRVGLADEHKEKEPVLHKSGGFMPFHQCPICSRLFHNASRLNEHKLTHDSDPRFHCDLCGAKFATPRYLTKHKNRHAKESQRLKEANESDDSRTLIVLLKPQSRIRRSGKQFECDICRKVFTTTGSLNRHKKILHNENVTQYICERCAKPFSTLGNLTKHMHTHKERMQCICDVCGVSYSRIETLRIHVEKNHRSVSSGMKKDDQLIDNTPVLQNNGIKKIDFNTERENQGSVQIVPEKCNVTNRISLSDPVVVHNELPAGNVVSVVREDLPNYSSEDYEKKLLSGMQLPSPNKDAHNLESENDIDNLVIADVSVTDDVERVEELTEDADGVEEPDGDKSGGDEEQHGQIKDDVSTSGLTSTREGDFYQCHYCGKICLTSYLLKTHIHTHTRPFVCTTCGKSFKQAGHLKVHRYTHNDAKLVKCDRCDKTFVNRSNLKKHHNQHRVSSHDLISGRGVAQHKEQRETTVKQCDNEKQKQAELLYINPPFYTCDICAKQYPTAGELTSHKYSHSRPFKCTMCSKTFTRANNLKRHKLTHDALRPYPCKFCDKSFVAASHLKQHTLLHTNTSVHTCAICKSTFAQVTYLEKHIRRKHHKP